MRLVSLLCLVSLLACTSVDLRSVRASDLAWLTGTWRGSQPDGTERVQVFSAPKDGAMQGVFRVFRGGEQIAESTMRILSGTNGTAMVGRLEGDGPRTFALVEIGSGRARFRSRTNEFPADLTYERSGDRLTLTFRGDSGLGAVREVRNELTLER